MLSIVQDFNLVTFFTFLLLVWLLLACDLRPTLIYSISVFIVALYSRCRSRLQQFRCRPADVAGVALSPIRPW